MKILSGSSASQYLPPDYLQPLPTTLDAKNSPLALLAQTCSSIGKDPPSKPIIPPIDRKDRASKSPSSESLKASSPKHSHKERPLSPPEKTRSVSRQDSKDITNFRPMSTSSPKPDKFTKDMQKTKEDIDRKITSDSEKDTKPQSTSSSRSVVSSPGAKSHSSESSGSPKQKPTDYSKDSRESREASRDVRYTPPPKRQRSESPQTRREYSPAADQKHQHSLYAGYPLGSLGYHPLHYGPASAEVLAAAGYPFSFHGQGSYGLAAAQANALAAHQAAIKSAGSAAALSQYMHYSRLRNPGPAPLSVCKDPYCTNCVSSAHIPSQCTSPGCTQCSQEKHLQNLSALGLAGHNPYSSLSSASVGLSALHSIYAQNMLSQQQQQQQHQAGQPPHVCNWMAGGDYCGKRFATSEELLQHLRTHTAGGESALSAYSSLGLNIPSELSAGGLPGYLGAASGNISPETLRRMYPTSLSPLGGTGLSSRYHPYKSGLPNVPSGLPTPQSLASVGPYYSAYNIYGQRIGAAAVP